MARFNEILVGRYNRFLQKLLSMKGGPVAAQLASEVQTTFPFFNGAENRYLEDWRRFGFGLDVAAVAAVNSGIRIRNPLTSNVVIVLEKASIGVTAAAVLAVFGMVQTNADLVVDATGINNRLDLRQGATGSSAIISNTDATHGPSGITTLRGFAPANQMMEFIWYENQEITLLPGQAADLFDGTVNQAVTCMLMWRERFLEESERF